MAKKKQSKAAKAASSKLKGEQTAKGREAIASTREAVPASTSFLNKPIGPGLKLTWKAVFLFLGFCLVLDVVLFALFKFGWDSCYALLCAFE